MRSTLVSLFALSMACSDPGSGIDGGPSGSDVPEGLDVPGLDAPPIPRDAPRRDAGDLSELSAMERMLVDLPERTWLRVPSGFRSVCAGDTDCSAVMAYSGAVWDPDHRAMLVWGGGHGDYSGNEVYAFSTRDFTWSRINDPSPGPFDRDILDDGRPVARHTYDGLTFLTGQGRMWAVGGSRSTDGSATSLVWTFDPLTGEFENDARSETRPIYFESSAVYDPVTARIYIKSGEQFYVYDPSAGTWTTPFDFGSPPNWPRYAGGAQRGVLDPTRRLIFYVGGDLFMVYDIDAGTLVTDAWVTTGGATFTNAEAVSGHPEQVITTGGGEILSAADPGLDYDVVADQLVAYTGRELMALDLTTRTWIDLGMDGAPPLSEPDPAFWETRIYGRFRYLEALNVFLLVQSSGDVWFYKHTP